MTASLTFELLSVPGPLESVTMEAFLSTCSDFYDQELPDCTTEVICTISNRRKLEMNPRYLQMNVNVPIDVTATFDGTCDATGFDQLVSDLIEANEAEFIAMLKNSDNSVVVNYFQSVDIEAFEPTDVVPPTAAPAISGTTVPPVIVPPTSSLPASGGMNSGMGMMMMTGMKMKGGMGMSMGMGMGMSMSMSMGTGMSTSMSTGTGTVKAMGMEMGMSTGTGAGSAKSKGMAMAKETIVQKSAGMGKSGSARISAPTTAPTTSAPTPSSSTRAWSSLIKRLFGSSTSSKMEDFTHPLVPPMGTGTSSPASSPLAGTAKLETTQTSSWIRYEQRLRNGSNTTIHGRKN